MCGIWYGKCYKIRIEYILLQDEVCYGAAYNYVCVCVSCVVHVCSVCLCICRGVYVVHVCVMVCLCNVSVCSVV